MGKKQNKKKPPPSIPTNQPLWKTWGKSALVFVVAPVVTILSGLYLVQFFVERMPGPHPYADVRGTRPMSGINVGCTYYIIMLHTDDSLEDLYMKVQFPTHIENFIVGFTGEAETALAGRVNAQMWAMGKNAKGECAIFQAAENKTAEVPTSATGNMIHVQTSKLPPKAMIMGAIATTTGKSSINPAPKTIFTEGSYKYMKLGLTITKPLRIVDLGVEEAKE